MYLQEKDYVILKVYNKDKTPNSAMLHIKIHKVIFMSTK